MIPYYYAGDDDGIIIEEKEGLARKLSAMKERLELLGYTMDEVQVMYDDLAKEYADAPFYEALSFNVFARLLKEIDIEKINTLEFAKEYDYYGYNFGEFVRRCIIPDKEIHDRLLTACGGEEVSLRGSIEYLAKLSEQKEPGTGRRTHQGTYAAESKASARKERRDQLSYLHRSEIEPRQSECLAEAWRWR